MPYHTGSDIPDVVRPLRGVVRFRRVKAFLNQFFRITTYRKYRFVAFIGLILVFVTAQNAFAQVSSRSGLSKPNSTIDDANSVPSGDSRRQQKMTTAKPSTNRQMSEIRPTSFMDDEESLPKNPLQLDEPIAAVLIEGNATIIQSDIAKHIKTRPGRPVTQKQIKEDVDALVRTRWFASVEPTLRETDEGIALVFRVLEKPIVRRVEYKGLRKVKQKVFDNLTQLKPGSPFDQSANRECARRIEEYYHDKGFQFATVELEKGNDRDDREVVFKINEGPKVHVTSVQFDGNKQFSDGILLTKTRTKTQILWLFGGKYDPSTINDDIDGVKQYYHGLGYFDVTIKENRNFSDDKSKLKILYDINEGVRYKIRKIEISGNEVLSEAEILELIKIEAGNYFNLKELNDDVEKIRAKYGDQGRLNCRVDPVRRFAEEPGILDIRFQIQENNVVRIREINVNIRGDHPHTKQNLVHNISPIQPGDLANPRKINAFKQKVGGSGYFEADVKLDIKMITDNSWIAKPEYGSVRSQSTDKTPLPETKPSEAKPRTDKTAVPNAPKLPSNGPQTRYMAPTTSFGLQGIDPEAAREESRNPFVSVAARFDEFAERVSIPQVRPKFEEDDRLSPITPIFRAQSMDPLRPPQSFGFDAGPPNDPYGRPLTTPDDVLNQPPPDFADIDISVADGRTGKLMFGVGVNSNAGLVGNIVLSESNFAITKPPRSWYDITNGNVFRGDGQKFKIEAQPGTQVSRYLVDWTDPYFLDSNFSLGVSGSYFQRYYRNWYEKRAGGRIRIGRQVTQHWSASAALRLESVDIYNPTTPSPQSLTSVLGTTLLSTFRGSVIHDTRDAAFNSSQGHYFEMSYEQAFGQFSFPRFEAEARQYFTTYRRVDGQGKHTVSVRGNLGWTGNGTPIYENFFAGGFQNFRGFAFRGVSPVDTGVYTGGNFMALGSVEYMLPVTANEMIKVVGFSDFGTINNGVSLDNFRVSVGSGVRLSIPMMGPVPIAIDFAVPIMQESTDIKQVVSFYIGVNR